MGKIMLPYISVLITGGTGSFGKNFIENLLINNPEAEMMVIFSRDEFKQFKMTNIPNFKMHEDKLCFFIRVVRDKELLRRVCSSIYIIMHAAELKQEQVFAMVMDALPLMQGVGLFVRKIPFMRIVELNEAICPSIKVCEIGIRPGEKKYGQMITANDALYTIGIDLFIIILSQMFFSKIDYTYDKGKKVPADFECHLENNEWWLSRDEMRNFVEDIAC